MDAFNNTEDNNRSREEALKAREIKVRLQEIEQELASIQPVKDKHQASQSNSSPTTSSQTISSQSMGMKSMKTRPFPFQLSKAARFWLIVIAVIVGIRLLNVLSVAVMIMSMTWMPPLIILGIAWVVYKLFYESDD